MGSIPGQGIKIMHATQHGQKKKKKKVESCQRTGKSESESVSHSVVPNSAISWNIACQVPLSTSGKNTGVGRHSLLQGIFPTQRFNLGLCH